MNATQYYKHDNFLVVQNGDWNDTFDLSKDYINDFFDVRGYLENQSYSELALKRVATILYNRFDTLFKEHYGYIECIIPNQKVTIDYLNDTSSKELQGRFGFYLNNRFVFAIHSTDFAFLMPFDGELSKDQYCKIVFELDKDNRNKLNQIIYSLNTLAKYDAN